MALHVQASIQRDFSLAKAYLCRDAGERAIFAKAERSRRAFYVRVDRHGNDRFDPSTNTIAWDPLSALRTTRGGRQTPALGLGHELAHAVEAPSRERVLENTPLARYDNAEERRVICGGERRAAHTLGEAIRFDHRGAVYRVATPVSR